MPEVKVRRKIFRLVGLLFPAVYAGVDRLLPGRGVIAAAGVVVLFLGIMIPLELARLRRPGVNRWLFDRFRRYTKEKERARFSSTTWFLAASLISILVFEKGIAIAAMLMLVAGDPVAEIVGTRWGRHPLAGKSLEGTLAGFAACVCVSAPLAWTGVGVTLPAILIGAVAATIFELIPLPIDDNFTIPLGAGAAMSLALWAAPMVAPAPSGPAAPAVQEADAMPGAPDPEPVERLLQEGRAAEATPTIDAALAAFPRDARWRALLVRSLRDERRYTEARRAVANLIEESPGSLPWDLLAASIDVRSGRIEDARHRLESRRGTSGDDPVLLARLAEAALLQGRRRAARELAELSLAIDSGVPAARYVLSRIARTVPEALGHLEALAQSGDPDAAAWARVLARRVHSTLDDFMIPAETTLRLNRTDDGRPMLRGEITGIGPVSILIDTAAAGLIVAQRHARQGGWDLPASTTAPAIGGLTLAAHPWIFDEVRLGAVAGRGVRALIAPLPEDLDAILNPFLLEGDTPLAFEIDLDGSALRITPQEEEGAPPCAAEGWRAGHLITAGFHVLVPIDAGDRVATALLDTGASLDLVDRAIITAFPEAEIGPAVTTIASWAGPIGPLQAIAGIRWRIAVLEIAPQRVLMTDLNEGRHRSPVDLDAVIGAGSIASLRLRIVPSAGCLAVRPAAGASGAVRGPSPSPRLERGAALQHLEEIPRHEIVADRVRVAVIPEIDRQPGKQVEESFAVQRAQARELPGM